MRSLFAGFTTRGRAFVAAGIATGLFGLAVGQRTLLSIGGLLVILPLLSLLAASRTRYRIRCWREISPARVPAGEAASVTVRLKNASRLPTGLLLAEDTVPYSLGARPRFVLDKIEPAGARSLTYPIHADQRGKYAIGPLHLRVADTFGLVKLGSVAAPAANLVVTPAITKLPRAVLAGTWLGEGGTRASTAAAAGEDDVVPRAYRDGDELRRVHWRSTARYGELMVRREEQRWRNRAVLFLDTRGIAHGGRGLSSSFEFAIRAAASIGVHLAREGIDGEFVTDTGTVEAPGSFENVLLDTLAVIKPSRVSSLDAGLAQIPRGSGGLLIAIAGYLPPEQARLLAAAKRTSGPAMALLLAPSTWATDRSGDDVPAETRTSASLLTAAGWRVTTVTAGTDLGTAWDLLNHPYQSRAGLDTSPAARAAAGNTAETGSPTAGSPAAAGSPQAAPAPAGTPWPAGPLPGTGMGR
jgi:uncharacterized protein (DUF58 family)